jgi:Na+-translocating membrane potential-generating system (MpsC)
MDEPDASGSTERGEHSSSADAPDGPVTFAAHPLEGGRLLAEITNRIVSLNREHLGRGPVKAKAYALDNLIVCVLCGGVTRIEQMLLDGGDQERVLATERPSRS